MELFLILTLNKTRKKEKNKKIQQKSKKPKEDPRRLAKN